MRFVWLVLALSGAAWPQPRVYLVHDDPEPVAALAAHLERNGYAVSVEDQAAFRRHMRAISPAAVFMYVHGDFDSGIENFLIRYAEEGGRLIVLHHGAASGKMRCKRWMPFLGLTIRPANACTHPWKVVRGNYSVVNLHPSHYVTTHKADYPQRVSYTPSDAPSAGQQLPAFELTDTEAFVNQVFTDGRRKTVLLGIQGTDNGRPYTQDRAGWLIETGKGHVFYFQPGHTRADFENPSYAQILLNAVAWRQGNGAPSASADDVLVPRVDGPWWRVAGNPDLAKLGTPKQQPVDFGVWQAADGTWQLWSCIRHTAAPGRTRLFYRWEGKQLTDTDWQPMGIAMQADPNFGETPGGLQAPHVVKVAGEYIMHYGDWEHICQARGRDGKTFERRLMPDGKSGMFTEGPGTNTRDVMLLRIGPLWHAYYTAYPDKRGAVYVRTSEDLRSWSASRRVAFGGSAGDGPFSAECPFVYFHRESGYYYLFRTQTYGRNAKTSVYRSKNPLDFGVNDDRYLVGALPLAAPEIVEHAGKLYIAALTPALDGIQIARLKFGR